MVYLSMQNHSTGGRVQLSRSLYLRSGGIVLPGLMRIKRSWPTRINLEGSVMCFIWCPIQFVPTEVHTSDQLRFELYRVPRDGVSMEAELVTLQLIVGSGDQGEPVITIMKDED